MTSTDPTVAAAGTRTRRRGRWIVLTLVVAAVVGLGGGGVATARAAGRADDVRAHLQAAAGLVGTVRQQLRGGDLEGARGTVGELQRRTRAARAATEDLSWRLAMAAPSVGDDAAAVRLIAVALDDLARDGVPALMEAAAALRPEALAPTGGRIDLDLLQGAAPAVGRADAAVRRARDRVAGVRTAGLRPQLRAALAELGRGLDAAAAGTAAAVRSTTLLPSMLGAQRPHTYLVLFQNLAEVRATGGMPGAYVVLRADRGALEIQSQGTAATDLGTFDQPVMELDPALRALYTDKIARYPANVNVTPHFPTAAALVREMYRRRTGQSVDGVLATDPVALSYLLAATGPVAVAGGPALTADSVVRVLLAETYARLREAEDQDRYYAAAARATFQAMTGGAFPAAKALAALQRAAGERRVLAWSADPVEQAGIVGTVLEGALPGRTAPAPSVGVFLNDGSGAKLGYYLRPAAELVAACEPDGRLRLRLTVRLRSTAPRTGLSRYVLGLGLAGDPYTARTNVSVFAPPGGALLDARLDGAAVPLGTGTEQGRFVGVVTVDVPPGGERTLEVTLHTAVPGPGAGWQRPALRTTPTVTPWQQIVRSPDTCRPAR
jgi:hypothetical protein